MGAAVVGKGLQEAAVAVTVDRDTDGHNRLQHPAFAPTRRQTSGMI